MKQSLQLKLGQQLTMTPQLQQAIRLLQLSTLDLQQEIQEALEANPLLEVSEDESVTAGLPTPEATPAVPDPDGFEEGAEWDPAAGKEANELPQDLPVDVQWDDLLPSSSAAASPASQRNRRVGAAIQRRAKGGDSRICSRSSTDSTSTSSPS